FDAHVRPGPDGRAADVPRPAFRAGRPSGSTALAGRLHPMAGSGGGRVRKRTEGRAEQVYLVPGFFGFANLGELRYFGHVRDFLPAACAAHGVPVVIHDVRTHPTASLRRRALRVLETMAATLPPGTADVHLIGHSSGGLDVPLLVRPEARLAPRRG